MREHRIRPEVFPEAWASDWGEDEYGLWMAFTYKGIKQVFRWIESGRFLMGSPRDEPQRHDDEEQHRITLSHGFWLADTVCSQALWEAIMGDNPSEFRGGNRPVESINLDNTRSFIEKINGMKPDLKLCLPTEAQWEYACRAGTTTPFSWGENISSDEVNYNGDYPYADGEISLNRGQTVEVKSLPPNHWGLYEMHGNVWEWCTDWYGVYEGKQTIDPDGPSKGDSRVLRGGSWINDGRYVRSACRHNNPPEDRYNVIGFRLARAH